MKYLFPVLIFLVNFLTITAQNLQQAPHFELEDLRSNQYELNNFKTNPLILHFGTTWCGSCQVDAKDFENFVESYKNTNLQFAKVFIGENPETVTDFLNHYRLNTLTLIDYNNSVGNKFNVDFYTTTYLIDSTQKILYKDRDIFYNNKKKKLKAILDTLNLNNIDPKNKAICTENRCYVPQNKTKPLIYELSPEAVIDNNNNIWITYYSNEDGNNNIYLRKYNKDRLIKQYKVTRNISNDYSPDITITTDQIIWLTWVSNSRGNYDIYTCSFNNEEFSKPIQITKSHDDAFQPSITSSIDNKLHLTYYKWDTLGDFSRDRDVFYKQFNKKKWTNEIRISPTEPAYDDASDPTIEIGKDNKVLIAYSYDYHPGKSKPDVSTKATSIFMQKIDKDFNPNDQKFIGTTENNIKYIIDHTPILKTDNNGNTWCVWDALANEKRQIMINNVTDNESSEMIISDISSICIEPDIDFTTIGESYVVWSQKENGKWEIFGCSYENEIWSSPKRLVNSSGNCMHPRLVLNDNLKYVVFSDYDENGSRIKLQEIE